jgi:predicted DNA-binding antitoxin AbrB/MazE fold protein
MYTERLPIQLFFVMKNFTSKRALLVFTGATVLLASLAIGLTKARSLIGKRNTPAINTRLNEMPRVILWAWERPTDLRFINPRETGVAFLARTIRLRAAEVVVRPRLQPLELPEGSKVIAVARVESDAVDKAKMSDPQRDKLAAAIAEMARLPNVSRIQIDFDATKSERTFYRDVIFEARRRLPENVTLSITALASWCTYDDWLSDLPIDEAVPMLFRMGVDEKQINNRLATGEDFLTALCRQSYGISTDEPRPNLSAARRLYVFNPDPWTEESVRAILESRK